MKRFFNIKIVAVLCLVTYLSVSLISAQFDLMTKRQQLAMLQEQQQRIEMETQDIRRIIEIEDEDVPLDDVPDIEDEEEEIIEPEDDIIIEIEDEEEYINLCTVLGHYNRLLSLITNC